MATPQLRDASPALLLSTAQCAQAISSAARPGNRFLHFK
ncbi:hypothetical protein OYC64_008557 [Pagothenia borchgrevinki]|uniref:Uncharacterized protein n=1 Tax=Pagothenia borchgrevinki TaxID=8213 RepID=A0ABD2G4Y3_PAGBO